MTPLFSEETVIFHAPAIFELTVMVPREVVPPARGRVVGPAGRPPVMDRSAFITAFICVVVELAANIGAETSKTKTAINANFFINPSFWAFNSPTLFD